MKVAIPFATERGTIDLANLRDEDMGAEIIGGTLAKLPRYNGRTTWPWSVASHSLLVEFLCPAELKGWALLHDAHEAFIGDITTPAVELLCLHGPEEVIHRAVEGAKARIDALIARAWHCQNRSHSLAIRQADWLALQVEMAAFFGLSLEGLGPQERDLADRALTYLGSLPRLSWSNIRMGWVKRAHELAEEGLLRLPPVPPGARAPQNEVYT